MREQTITFFTKAHFCFFFKIMLESWGCGLYTSAAYTRVFTVHIVRRMTEYAESTLMVVSGIS